MKILEKLFGGREMTAVAERTEGELQARLQEVTASLALGEGDIEAAIEERETITRKLEAARIVRERQQGAAYRAKLEAATDEFRDRLLPIAERVADLVPRLHFELATLAKLEEESYDRHGAVFAATGIPLGFASAVNEAIRESSRNVEWDYSHLGDSPGTNDLPTPKAKIHGKLVATPTNLQGWPTDAHGTPLILNVRT